MQHTNRDFVNWWFVYLCVLANTKINSVIIKSPWLDSGVPSPKSKKGADCLLMVEPSDPKSEYQMTVARATERKRSMKALSCLPILSCLLFFCSFALSTKSPRKCLLLSVCLSSYHYQAAIVNFVNRCLLNYYYSGQFVLASTGSDTKTRIIPVLTQ